MKKGLTTFVVCLAFFAQMQAQQSVSIGTTNTNPSAVLWLNSPTNNQALIIPVVNGTNAVANPVAGMVVYDQTTNAMYVRNSTTWEKLGGSVTLTAGAGINIAGNTISNTGDTNAADDITTTTPAAGDLSGTYPNPTVARIRGVNISATTPTLNQILQYNGATWTPATIAASGTVTNVSASAPLSVATATTTPVISITQANTTTSGFVSAADWTTFNNKIGATTAATTDLSGTFGAPTVARIRGVNVSATAPTINQVLQYNGTNWTPITLPAGFVNPMTAQGDVIFGGAAGAATRLAGTAGFLKSTGAFAPTWSAINLASADVTGTLPVANGGTGAITAALARTNLGLGTLSTLSAPNFGAQNVITTGAVNSAALTSTGAITFGSLAGAGSRMVVADPTGILGTQPIPVTFSTLNIIPKGDGATGMVASSIFDNGNVGIGTTTPGYQLDVSKILASGSDAEIRTLNTANATNIKSGIRFETGSGWAVHLQTSQSGNWLELTNNAGGPVHTWNFDSYYPGNGAAFLQGTGGNLAMMGGRVGVGTTAPGQPLDVNGNLRMNGYIYFYDGKILFHVPGSYSGIDDHWIPNVSNGYDLGTSLYRWRTIYLINNPSVSSDRRLKENIADLKYGLSEVLQLRPVRYSFREDKDGKTKLGLIAQEVEKIIPEIVEKDNSAQKYLAITYSDLIPVLINAIQEQQRKIEALEAKVKTLQLSEGSELEQLKAEVSEIRKALSLEAKSVKKEK